MRIRGIGLVCAGGVLGVVGVDGSGVGRFVVMGGYSDVVGGWKCGAWLSDCRAAGAVLLVVR